ADDSQLASAGADGSVRLWNVADGSELRSMAPEVAEGQSAAPLYDVTFSGNGQQVAAAGRMGAIGRWTLANGTAADPLGAGGEAIYRLFYLANGHLLACGH